MLAEGVQRYSEIACINAQWARSHRGRRRGASGEVRPEVGPRFCSSVRCCTWRRWRAPIRRLRRAAAAAAAATRLLRGLDPEQARAAVLPADSRLIVNWSNLPAGRTRFERNGVRIGDLGDSGRAALADFLAAALSPAGAELVRGIIAAESVLADAPRASGARLAPRQLLAGILRRAVGGALTRVGSSAATTSRSTWRSPSPAP